MQMWTEAKKFPDILAERREGESVEIDFCPNQDLFQFQGHFPGQPIVPGVAQLDWAVQFAKTRFSTLVEVKEVSQLKFRELMQPGAAVTLKLDFNSEKNSITFRYFQGETVYSSGIIKLGTP